MRAIFANCQIKWRLNYQSLKKLELGDAFPAADKAFHAFCFMPWSLYVLLPTSYKHVCFWTSTISFHPHRARIQHSPCCYSCHFDLAMNPQLPACWVVIGYPPMFHFKRRHTPSYGASMSSVDAGRPRRTMNRCSVGRHDFC